MVDMAEILPKDWFKPSKFLLIGILGGSLLGLGLGWFGLFFGFIAGGLIGEIMHRVYGVNALEQVLRHTRVLTFRQSLLALGAGSVLVGASKNHFQITQKQLDLFQGFLTQLDPVTSASKVTSYKQMLSEVFREDQLERTHIHVPSNAEISAYYQRAKEQEPSENLLVWMYHLASATDQGADQDWIDFLGNLEKEKDFLTHARLTWYPNHQALTHFHVQLPCEFNQVRTAYRKTLLQVHPDQAREKVSDQGSTEAFLAIQEAYKLLEWQHLLTLSPEDS
jgi:hypothetical protein